MVQVAGEAVMSVVFHKPPSTPPTKTVLWVASDESTMIALILPEATPLLALGFPLDGPIASLLGPLSCQASASMRLGLFMAACLDCLV